MLHFGRCTRVLQSMRIWIVRCCGGLYRHRKRDGGERTVSVFPLFDWRCDMQPVRSTCIRLFKGLFGYEREGDAKQIQLLYFFRFGDKQTSNP